MKRCKFCNSDFELPENKESNDHWMWESKKDRPSSGLHYCRINRTERKRMAWNNFYKRKQLRCAVSRAINGKLKRRGSSKNGSILNNLPYTIETLKVVLESKFKSGMNWGNYGEWEIDHLIPDSNFNYDKMTDIGFKESWSLSNLQPLWKTDNRHKYNKIEE